MTLSPYNLWRREQDGGVQTWTLICSEVPVNFPHEPPWELVGPIEYLEAGSRDDVCCDHTWMCSECEVFKEDIEGWEEP
jgi:hypothetical protein